MDRHLLGAGKLPVDGFSARFTCSRALRQHLAACARAALRRAARILAQGHIRDGVGSRAFTAGKRAAMHRDQPHIRLVGPPGFPGDLRGVDQGSGQVSKSLNVLPIVLSLVSRYGV